MNRSDFIQLMENSGEGNHHLLGELNSLINAFPYFQSAYMLLLKGLQKSDDVKFESQLRNSALRIANREVLYYYLKKEPELLTDADDTKISEIIHHNEVIDNQQVVIELGKNSEDLINEIEKKDNLIDAGNKSREYAIIITAESGDRESDASLIIVNEESGEIEEKVVFMDPGFSIPLQEDLLELDTGYDKISDLNDQDITDTYEEDNKENVTVKQIQSELIDRFIIANPRIEPVKEHTDIPLTDISKPYTEEKEEFLSETLARIYIKQGYYSKAINIYEKLSLKYPEKSSYFASLIMEVQEFIKK